MAGGGAWCWLTASFLAGSGASEGPRAADASAGSCLPSFSAVCVRAEDRERSRVIRVSPGRAGTVRNGLWAHDQNRASLRCSTARNREGAGRAPRQGANFIPPSYGELVEAQGGYQ